MEKNIKIYHVETQEDYDDLIIKLEELGCKWFGGEKPTEHDIWYKYKNNTLVIIKEDMTLRYGNKTYPKVQAIKYKTKGVEQMEKVVVPQFVADWFEKNKNAYILSILLDELQATEDEDIVNWRNNCEGRFVNNFANAEEAIAKMYIFEDYEVEEEKKYYWRKKKEYLFDFEYRHSSYYINLDTDDSTVFLDDKEETDPYPYRTKFTEIEIRKLVSKEDFSKLERVEIDE